MPLDVLPSQPLPKAHAVIVHHRGKAMLGRCLASLLASREVALEIVVVSNDCHEELPKVAESSPRIHVVPAPRSLGFSEANNLGVAWARERLGEPDAYYFVNNDTASEPGALAALLAALRAEPEAAIAGPQLRILGAPDHLNSLGLNLTEDAWGWDEGIGLHLDDYGPLPERREVIAVTGSALLADAAVYREAGGWTEIYDYYFEDLDLCLKVWDRGRRVIHVPEALVYHQISATMTEGSERKEHFFWRNRLMLATIHWPLPLLWSVYYRAVVTEILSNRWIHNRLQRRALKGALRRLPALLRQRWRSRGPRAWRRFLYPPGSVPVIALPATEDPFDEPSRERRAERGAELAAGVLGTAGLEKIRGLRPADGDCRRVLVVGWAPLPFENQRMNYAPGVRSWQLAGPLAADGHAVLLICGRIPGACGSDLPDVEVFERAGVLCLSLADGHYRNDDLLAELAGVFEPGVVVGASALPSRRALRIAGELPLWVDLFGDPMAEAQAKAAAAGAPDDRDHLAAYWHLLMELLERGDAFGAVSERQKYAVLGQLGLAGRLGPETAGVELVHTVPCCVPATAAEEADGLPPPADLDAEAFVVLWSGGYNTWGDVDTLFEALERAMAARPEIRFVSTGGEIEGHDESSYGRFRRLAEGCEHRDRFLFKGRLPERHAARYFRRADLGVVTERVLAERLLGSSGRVLRWMADGLPFVCTRLSELGETVAAEDLGLTYPPGDAAALAGRIVAAAADREKLRRRARRARAFAAERLTAEATTRGLRAWVAGARRSARAASLPEPFRFLRSELERTAAELAEARDENRALRDGYHRVRAELGDVHQSRMWKLWVAYLRTRRLVLWPFRR